MTGDIQSPALVEGNFCSTTELLSWVLRWFSTKHKLERPHRDIHPLHSAQWAGLKNSPEITGDLRGGLRQISDMFVLRGTQTRKETNYVLGKPSERPLMN